MARSFEIGQEVLLLKSSKRYFGGRATVLRKENNGYILERHHEVGSGKKFIWAHPGEIDEWIDPPHPIWDR